MNNLSRLDHFAEVYAAQYGPERAAQYAKELDEKLPRYQLSDSEIEQCKKLGEIIAKKHLKIQILRAAMREIDIVCHNAFFDASALAEDIKMIKEIAARFVDG